MPITEKILIADKSVEFCKELTRMLERADYVNVEAVTSYEGLKEAFEKEFYNIVIADCMLAGYDDIDPE